MEKYLIEYSRQALRNIIFSKANRESGIARAIKQDSYCFTLKEEISMCVNEHMHLWEMLEEMSPNQQNIEYIGCKILSRIKKIYALWGTLTDLKMCTHKISVLYCLYLYHIIRDESQSNAIQELYYS